MATMTSPTTRKPVGIAARALLLLVAAYKRGISPLLGSRCRFHPSCSDYARQAIIRHGAWHGGLLALWRIARCQPLSPGGIDRVPTIFRFPPWRAADGASADNDPDAPPPPPAGDGPHR